MSLKLYGVPLSQPFRSVAWSLLLNKTPFVAQICVPGATNKIGSQHESFLSKTRGRTGTVPLLEDGDLCVSESPAILKYLSESKGWTTVYPQSTPEQQEIDAYSHWHHSNTRNLFHLTKSYLRPELKLTVTDQAKEETDNILTSLDTAWLQDGKFVGGTSEASMADLLAYEELIQATILGGLDVTSYTNLSRWMSQMEQLPFHEEAHAALTTLGNVTEPFDMPMPKRLGAATKAGMEALKEAQKSFS